MIHYAMNLAGLMMVYASVYHFLGWWGVLGVAGALVSKRAREILRGEIL